jgi:hypothetical protein
MRYFLRPLLGLMIAVLAILAVPTSARADGGMLRLREQNGAYQIAVFTLPTPLRAGPVDISVLVQDAVTGECLPEAHVTVHLTHRESHRSLTYPATAEAATNKLFQAAIFDLPEPGWWDVEVAVARSRRSAVVRFSLEADEPLPRWLDLWPWFTWPAIVVVFFGIHQIRSHRLLIVSPRKAQACGMCRGAQQ